MRIRATQQLLKFSFCVFIILDHINCNDICGPGLHNLAKINKIENDDCLCSSMYVNGCNLNPRAEIWHRITFPPIKSTVKVSTPSPRPQGQGDLKWGSDICTAQLVRFCENFMKWKFQGISENGGWVRLLQVPNLIQESVIVMSNSTGLFSPSSGSRIRTAVAVTHIFQQTTVPPYRIKGCKI